MMFKTIHVTHGDDGKIFAASESSKLPRPAHLPGATVGAFEVPAKFAGKPLHDYISHLEVDVAARRLKEKAHR